MSTRRDRKNLDRWSSYFSFRPSVISALVTYLSKIRASKEKFQIHPTTAVKVKMGIHSSMKMY